ncbi:tRNA (adenosine(37)-N6)-threonylcarbamoyltransferase complex dimerization subunit type 1 TsaB [Nitratireductor kimnyeongensis]|uniref:tRNA (Adenosine(37)-N6)-threonylcarbamoyltransferase complex dimerization subunit type 1 TsaB n=1 Tax=Nitratireductor kimnyeongensis TaxID=430679 RepID=A0ABW0T7A7_9HYPH|nr:tRNA (adenosine(37)-N6)-threonylcarbamoyltransferase complex dimerization subunit type 1 TsaB [Nitratireductor kimnyeongensis]QZZ34082.1 tRNA (adenosine(37)-N6)-threonylcarbamoyltransferase complex dimerization subunit type 1 TsaB [Nitratireductor kimnyeongensis]
MKILAIDTAAALCAACVLDTQTDEMLGRHVLDLGKGHAEHVMSVIEGALQAAGLGYDALGAVAVSVGPGSFTGVRVGVSAARGLALALKVPAIGISTLEALGAEARDTLPGRTVLVALGQRAPSLFAAGFDSEGRVLLEPQSQSAQWLAGWASIENAVVYGVAAELVAEAGSPALDIQTAGATADILTFARLAATKEGSGEPPKPLYLRAPDAAPQQNFALPRRER